MDYELYVLRSKSVELTTTGENYAGRRFTIGTPRHRFSGFPKQEQRTSYKVLVVKPEGEGQFLRHRVRLEGNNKMDFIAMEWEGADWVNLADDRELWEAVVNSVMKLSVP